MKTFPHDVSTLFLVAEDTRTDGRLDFEGTLPTFVETLEEAQKVAADTALNAVPEDRISCFIYEVRRVGYVERREADEKAEPEPPAAPLSRDTEIVAYAYWGLGIRQELTFLRPHVISPRMRLALDELTERGLLFREDDPRGPITWRPAPGMYEVARACPPRREGEQPIRQTISE